jgi:hypothetical protein
MLDSRGARERMESLLREWGNSIEGGLVILDHLTLHKPYGWIFFYNSRLYMETRAFEHAIAGNGPVVIIARTEEVVPLGSARRPEDEIAAFERDRGFVAIG